MLTRKSRLLAMLLCLVLVMSLLAGCGSSSSSSDEEAEAETTEEATEESAEVEEEEAGEEEAAEEETEEAAEEAETEETSAGYGTVSGLGGTTPVDLPLTEETETITMWMPWSSDVAQYADDPYDTTFWVELEERTNVHVDFTLANSVTATEQFNLLVASGSYPDIINGFTSRYTGGAEAGVEQGVVIDLMEYSDLMPNLMEVLEDENVATYMITDSGYLVEPCNVYQSMTLYTDGPLIRQDWLDELGLDTPVTYDDWYEVLTAFKNSYDITSAFFLSAEGAMVGNFLSSGYGVASISAYNVFTPFFIDNGEVKFGPSESGWEEYVTMLAQWYEEGLINPDFVSMTDSDAKRGEVMGNNTGIWIGDAPDISSYEETANGEMDISPIADPTVDESGDGYMNKVGTYTTTDGYAVTVDAENVELIAKWIDYQYSEEGSFLANYGVEGEGFEYDENGDPQLTELVTDNPDGITMISAMEIYMRYQGSFVNDWTRNIVDYTDEELLALDLWNVTDSAGGLTQWPTSMELNEEESDLYNQYWADIDTYYCEMLLKYITGAESLDTMDEFRENLESMGIAYCIEAKQDCYDRYTS